MAYEIVMPQLSDSMEEGKLVNWKVHPGDRVKTGDVIAEVESDKAVMEIQSFKDGVVKELKVQEGESVPVGTVIAVLETTDGGEEKREKEEPKEAPKSLEISGQRRPLQKSAGGSKSAVDELFGTEAKVREPEKAERSVVEEGTGGSGQKAAARFVASGEASPKARAVAAAYGIDIEALQTAGKLPVPAHEADIKEWYLRRYFTPKALRLIELYGLDAGAFERSEKVDEEDVKEYIKKSRIPLPKPISSNRKAVITAVTRSSKKPVYRIYDTIDSSLLKRYETEEFTYTVWLLKLFAKAMMEHEEFRTTLKEETLLVWPGASISLAMAEGEDLYAPVFKDLDTKSVAEISSMLEQMKERIKSKKIEPDDLSGSTFGLSNLGMTGIKRFDAMINREDSAIAAVGSEIGGEIAITLTVDHRVVNGYQAALFMQTVKRLAADDGFFERVKKGGN